MEPTTLSTTQHSLKVLVKVVQSLQTGIICLALLEQATSAATMQGKVEPSLRLLATTSDLMATLALLTMDKVQIKQLTLEVECICILPIYI